MRKIYLFDLSDLFLLNNNSLLSSGPIFTQKNEHFPKDDDPKFNKTVEETETNTHIIKKETWISTDGTQKFTRTLSESKQPKVDVKLLESKLKEAIEKEEFEIAAKIRDEIKKFK